MALQGFDKAPAITLDQAKAMIGGLEPPYDGHTDLYFYGFYLGGPCYLSSDREADGKARSFTSQLHQEYIDIGFNLAYIYVGCQDQPTTCHSPTTTEEGETMGKNDAIKAMEFATDIGVPEYSVIYLDVEGGNSHSAEMLAYVRSWVSEINNSNFVAGIYCSAGSHGTVAQQLYDEVGGQSNMWVAQFQCNPGSSKVNEGQCNITSCTNTATLNDLDLNATSLPNAYIRQYAGNVHVKYNNTCLIVDLNIARDGDPNIKQF
ncbi:glycoside hydrolase domain-containing protein [Neobacillus drentensis]|uniref:glycoside hydrolase domain-containing protein n=1 Tax=Neobacillus drentensis TaxID=220684 RepID=UPI002FFF09F7